MSTWKLQQRIIRRALRRRRVPRVRPGAPPGTLLPPESAVPQETRVTVMRYTADTLEEREVKAPEECLEPLERPGVTWINIDGLGRPEILARLAERLHFHPLAVEDVVNAP